MINYSSHPIYTAVSARYEVHILTVLGSREQGVGSREYNQ